jgi:hypothetical protein
LDSLSESGEVFDVDDGLLVALALEVGLLFATFLLSARGGLLSESEAFKVLIKSSSAGGELDDVLSISLAVLLVFLALKHNELFLLDPFSIDLSLLGRLLLIDVIQLNTLVLVVFFKSEGFGLFGLGLLSFLSDCLNSRGLLSFGLLDVFILVEIVLDVADVALASSFLTRLITK